jgi:hypothetical protein
MTRPELRGDRDVLCLYVAGRRGTRTKLGDAHRPNLGAIWVRRGRKVKEACRGPVVPLNKQAAFNCR